MKSQTIILTIFLLFSCGQSTEFILQKTKIQFIQNLDKTNSSPDDLVKGDSIFKNSLAGVVLSFEVDYIGSGGSQEPGNKGTKDTITEVSIIVAKKDKKLNITNDLTQSSTNNFSTYEYNTSLNDIKDFTYSFNNLQLEKRENLNYKDIQKIGTGYDLENSEYIFWIPKPLSKQLSKNDTIKVEIKLSDNRLLKDKVILK